jgi:hypothetical protein
MKIAEFSIKTILEYAKENQVPPRSTSDLSPMETWLILRLYELNKLEIEEKQKDYKNIYLDKSKSM